MRLKCASGIMYKWNDHYYKVCNRGKLETTKSLLSQEDEQILVIDSYVDIL